MSTGRSPTRVNRLAAILLVPLLVVLGALGWAIKTGLVPPSPSHPVVAERQSYDSQNLRHMSLQSVSRSAEEDVAIKHITVTFIPRFLNSSRRNLRTLIRLTVPDRLALNLVDLPARRPVAVCSGALINSNCEIREDDQNKQFIFVLRVLDKNHVEPIYRTVHKLRLTAVFHNPFSLHDIFYSGGAHKVFTFRANIPLDGDAAMYPQDKYYFQIQMFIGFGPLGIPGYPFYAPIVPRSDTDIIGNGLFGERYFVDFAEFLEHYDYSIQTQTGNLCPAKILFSCADYVVYGQLPETFSVSLSRPSNAVIYIYALASIPFFLALLIVALLAFSRTSSDHSAYILGLFSIALIALPLRTVLVPADIEGLTRVDLLLGADILLVAMLAALITAFRPVQSGEHPN